MEKPGLFIDGFARSLPLPFNETFAALDPAMEYPAAIGLFKQGAAAQNVYLIEEGLVKLIRVEPSGREMIVGLRSPGWMVGAASVILGNKYAFSATTLTSCQLRRIPVNVFLSLLKTDASFSWYFHQVQSFQICDYFTRLADFGCLSARDRLLKLLALLVSVSNSNDQETKIRLRLPLKNWEVAELIAVTPEHLSRVLKEMQREGFLNKDKGWIVIPRDSILAQPGEQ